MKFTLYKYTKLLKHEYNNRNSLKWLCFVIFSCIIVVLFLQFIQYITIRSDYVALPERIKHNNNFFVKTKGCRIPFMDAWDNSIKKYVKKVKAPICNNGKPALFGFNFTSIFLIESSLEVYNITEKSLLTCCYQNITRQNPKLKENDNKMSIGKICTPVKEGVASIKDEYIILTCDYNKTKVYTDVFWFVPSKIDKEKQKTFDVHPLNVLIVGLDAVSRLNLHRQMPKTVDYLHSIGSIELLGYNKVGDNTFPNLIPVLTGQFEEEIKKTCWLKNLHFDNCTYLWDLYKERGYVTSFGEDSTWMGLFNYQRRGFTNQPTDYAYGYYNRISEKKIGNSHNFNVFECIGSRDIYKDLLNYMTSVTLRMKMDETPYFAFYWGASLSHDYLNKPSIGDGDYLRYFRNLKDQGYLEDTVLIFMSDHGIRWGDIRQTYQGRMEERMPFVFIRLPEWYIKKFDQAYNNLLENVHKLTTPFDLHETIKDLLDPYQLTADYLHNRDTSNHRGISLFSDIPETRTCESAAIDAHWCTCQQSVEISTNHTTVVEAGNYIVSHMNSLLEGNAECANLVLDQIVNARLMVHGKKIMGGKLQFQDYMITVRTLPGEGLFENTVRYFLNSKTFNVTGTISRLNMYGSQSACITDYHLKLYCFCKSLL
ncbi:uncharacterized protein LOC109595872 [Aethina tumida]|uniref:uncharacterized protein LOC109595872 n=1 Tax=Aethina tumida TaxID=116153 RepID=UPI0021498335|nr:uncharacterized protein LOC109595872 [Aethina tumida]